MEWKEEAWTGALEKQECVLRSVSCYREGGGHGGFSTPRHHLASLQASDASRVYLSVTYSDLVDWSHAGLA